METSIVRNTQTHCIHDSSKQSCSFFSMVYNLSDMCLPSHHLSLSGKYWGKFRERTSRQRWYSKILFTGTDTAEHVNMILSWYQKQAGAYYLLDKWHVVGLHFLDVDPDAALAVQVILAARTMHQECSAVNSFFFLPINIQFHFECTNNSIGLLEHVQPFQVLLVLLVHQVHVSSMLVQGWIKKKSVTLLKTASVA